MIILKRAILFQLYELDSNLWNYLTERPSIMYSFYHYSIIVRRYVKIELN